MANRLRRCHDCNFPLGSKDLFCPRCGARQRREKLERMTRQDTLGRRVGVVYLPK